jgi:hypothetical protein
MDEFLIFFRKYIEPYLAVGILIFLIISSSLLVKEYNQRKHIAETCGWADEDTRCFCQRSDVIRMENELKGIIIDNEFNVSDGLLDS